MQSRRRIFDDAAVLAGGVLGTFSGVRREAKEMIRHQLDRLLSEMDFVTRDEFNAVKEMAVKARNEQQRQAGRIEALEEAVNELAASSPAVSGIRNELDSVKSAAARLAEQQQQLETRITVLEDPPPPDRTESSDTTKNAKTSRDGQPEDA